MSASTVPALAIDRDVAIESFHARSADPGHQVHRDAQSLVHRSAATDPIGDMYDALQDLITRRPNACSVPVRRGDIDVTYATLTASLLATGISW